MHAVTEGNQAAVDRLLGAGAYPNVVDEGGSSALMLAIYVSMQDAVVSLMNAGAHPLPVYYDAWTEAMDAEKAAEDSLARGHFNSSITEPWVELMGQNTEMVPLA